MGLKTTNYVSKSLGITLPTAYAMIGDLLVNRNTNSAKAVFLIQATRENAENYKPVDEVAIDFTWDRKTDPARMAYEAAKAETREYQEYDPETKEEKTVTEYGVLYGWQDDYA